MVVVTQGSSAAFLSDSATAAATTDADAIAVSRKERT